MRTVPEAEFLSWVAEAEIGVDPEYAENWPRNLSFRTEDQESRYWLYPKTLRELEPFLGKVLEGVGGGELFLWAKCDGWSDDLREESAVCAAALADIRAKVDSEDAVAFGPQDRAKLLLVLALAVSFGWSWPTDLYVLSEKRDVILMFDHHDCVWASFRGKEVCDTFVAHMREAGHDLPTSPPDETFKPADWMGDTGGT